METSDVNIKNWRSLIKPPKIDVKLSDDKTYAKIIAEPLEKGYGLTLGNTLRRVLLSSIRGTAVTAIQIDGVLHEFTSIKGVREDVTDIVLNIKSLALKSSSETPKKLILDVKGPGEIKASNIKPLADIEILNPDLIICGHSYQTRDWVPRLSARLDIPFISDCIDFSNDESSTFIRPIYQAKLNEKIKLNGTGIVSFQAGSFSKDDLIQGSSSVDEKSLDLSDVNLTIRPADRFKESADGVDLSAAEVIVSIGRGLAKEENIPLAKSLAEKLNAQIGASRPVVDAGWLDHSYQIGSSGQTVSPKLYLAVGISGAIQHLVGMKGSKNIMAINKDPNAPIFEISDYAVIGDIFEILPKLIEQL